MAKSILMSIRPQYVCGILNGKKTIEIRKRFPRDYVGWVYIYCTKGGKCLTMSINGYRLAYNNKLGRVYNGKVVARFWCDKVEEIECISVGDSDYGSLCADTEYCTETLSEKELTQKSCVLPDEIFEYLDEYFDKVGYAIHISKVEVFEKPKELKEFKVLGNCKKCSVECSSTFRNFCSHTLEKAPQSWCYVEGE